MVYSRLPKHLYTDLAQGDGRYYSFWAYLPQTTAVVILLLFSVSLCWDDPLEKEMATNSSILAWEIPWTEEPGGLQSMGSHKSWTQLSD